MPVVCARVRKVAAWCQAYSPTDGTIPRINACNSFPNSLEAFVVSMFRTHSMLYELADLAIRSLAIRAFAARDSDPTGSTFQGPPRASDLEVDAESSSCTVIDLRRPDQGDLTHSTGGQHSKLDPPWCNRGSSPR
jgi:hypothetical protein